MIEANNPNLNTWLENLIRLIRSIIRIIDIKIAIEIKLKLLNPYVIGFRSAICSDLNRKFLSEKKLIFLSSQFFSNKSNAIESAGA